jgi:4'-phosphopantetheinyl transferase
VRCEVWWARPEAGFAELDGVLDPGERERCSRFRDRGALLRHVTGRTIVRLLLGAHLGVAPAAVRLTSTCTWCGCANGKPRLAQACGVSFSVSHSGDRVAVAIAWGAEVGVDVEEIGPVDHDVADRVLCPAERRPGGAGFHLAWARKEALLKATGYGLSVTPSSVELSPPHEPPRLVRWSARRPLSEPVSMRDLDAGPGYAASLALLTDRPFVVREFDAVPRHDLAATQPRCSATYRAGAGVPR